MTLQVFTLAAVLHPEKCRILQDEIDSVTGRERLPTFDDTEKMPYLAAFVKEVHRWRPVLPGGVPHAVTADDTFMGYHIPKGATIVPGHWAMSMDQEMYPNPDAFEPERFLRDPELPYSQFGFGRRKCIGMYSVYPVMEIPPQDNHANRTLPPAGQYVGNNSMMINVARMLWAYDFKKGWVIVNGKKVEARVDPLGFYNGFNSPPLPFKVLFVPRDAKVSDILRSEFLETEKKGTEAILQRIEEAALVLKEGEKSVRV